MTKVPKTLAELGALVRERAAADSLVIYLIKILSGAGGDWDAEFAATRPEQSGEIKPKFEAILRDLKRSYALKD
jgi:hypothetical protein